MRPDPFPETGLPHPALDAVGRHRATLVTGAFLGLCLLAGGGTRQGLPIEALLQLVALALLPYALWRLTQRPLSRAALLGLIWFALLAAVIAAQLVPLPESWWTDLAGRDELARELALAGVAAGARPISLDPDATLRALFALLPPLTAGLLALGLRRHQQVRLLQGLLIVAIGSALLGLAQLASGPDSPLRWHAITNTGGAVGVFANRNHLATLLVIGLPLAAAQMINAGARIVAGEQRPRRTAALAAGVLAGLLLLLGLAMVKSRAGVLLAGVAVAACAAMLWRRHEDDERPRRGVKRWLALSGLAGLILAIQFGFWGLMQRFEVDPMDDLRWTISRNTMTAAEHFGRLGVGAGGFIAAYQSTEPPEDRDAILINRAHNDWAEWRLEGGWPLLGVIALGLLLLAWRTVQAWRERGDPALWQRAAVIGLWLILLHSLGDYPLRTTALSVVAAVLLVHALRERPR